MRGREATRAEVTFKGRTSRRAATLDLGGQFKLDVHDPSKLDPDYYYRFVNDENGRVQFLNRSMDYDFVAPEEVGEGEEDGLDATHAREETSTRVRRAIGTTKDGRVQYAYLMKIPKVFKDTADEADVERRMDQMEAVEQGAVIEDPRTGSAAGVEEAYVPPKNRVGRPPKVRPGQPYTP